MTQKPALKTHKDERRRGPGLANNVSTPGHTPDAFILPALRLSGFSVSLITVRNKKRTTRLPFINQHK